MNLKTFKLIVLAGCLFPFLAKSQNIRTVVGNGVSAYTGDGGPATASSINLAYGVALGGKHSIYIADCWNYCIRHVSETGVITTIAGTGTAGYSGDNGAAVSATLNLPTGLIIDPTGNIYICDQLNYSVRKIDTAGIITTIAGNGTVGYSGDGGPATNATMNLPTCLVADTHGNIFISDQFNQVIRKVDPTGIITTYAGGAGSGFAGDGGPATDASLSFPCGVCLDTAGNLYIADYGNNRVRKVEAATGIISTYAGNGSSSSSGDGGPATAASMTQPWGMASDNLGNIYVAVPGDSRIRRIDASGMIITIAGDGVMGSSGDGGPAIAAELYNPTGMAIDAIGTIYFTDEGNSKVRQITAASDISTTATHTVSSHPEVIVYPNPATDKICVFAGNINENVTVNITDESGKVIETNIIDHTTGFTTFNTSHLPVGLYFCKVANNDGIYVYKFNKK